MKHIFKILTAAVLLMVLVWPSGEPAGDTGDAGVAGGSGVADSRSVEIGLEIELGADWISFVGVWTVLDDAPTRDSSSACTVRQVRIGSVPNVVKRAQKGIALFRAVRTTTVCLVKQWLGRGTHSNDS